MQEFHWVLLALFVAVLMVLAFYAWDEATTPVGQPAGQHFFWHRWFRRSAPAPVHGGQHRYWWHRWVNRF